MPTQDIEDYTFLVSVSVTTPGGVKILDPDGNEIDPRDIRALTSSDGITVYGSQAQKLLQKALTYELLVQLQNAGIEIDPRDRTWEITEELARSWNLGDSDVPDLKDRAARLLGVVASITDPITSTEEPASSIGDLGDVTPNGSTVQITAASTACKAVYVRALGANTNKIRVGTSTAGAARGGELSAGDAVIISVDNVNKVYVYGAAGTDKVSCFYVN
jgi:hypothetical protein